MGRVVYARSESPTFAGGTRIDAGVIQWRLPKIAASADYAFGTKPIILSAGCFCFGAAECRDQTAQLPTLTTALLVTGRNGILEYDQEDLGEKGKIMPHSRFTGRITLGGGLMAEFNTVGGVQSNQLLDGPITLLQQPPPISRWSAGTSSRTSGATGPGSTGRLPTGRAGRTIP